VQISVDEPAEAERIFTRWQKTAGEDADRANLLVCPLAWSISLARRGW